MRILKLAVIAGLLAGLVVSAAMTYLDWMRNPGGIFHSQSGTDWGVVAETALSWSWPVTLVTVIAAVIILNSIAWIRAR